MSLSNQSALKSGVCPKCSSTEVYSNRDLPSRGERNNIAVSSMKFIFVNTYLCLNCRYFEEYIREKELKDKKVIDKIKSTWLKL